jgi:hypothetical protein
MPETLRVQVTVLLDDTPAGEVTAAVPIPPDYDATDTAALAVRQVEDTAAQLLLQVWGRAPTREALRAAAARLWRLEKLLPLIPAGQPYRAELAELLALSNAEARDRWGDEGGGD